MGNCCGTAAAVDDKDNVRRNKGQRLSNWSKTGVIALRRAALTELPAEVAQVPSPRVLDASLNRIERLPPSLPTSLQRLVLSSNRLSSLDGLEQLCNLKVLVLDGNRITHLPDWLGELTKLETLSVGDNAISELPASLGNLTRLRQLLVCHNKLRRLPEELGNCSALEELDVHHNALEELPASLGRLQRLKLLQLDSNQISALPTPILRDCSALSTISLHDNPISAAMLQSTEGYAAFEARRQHKVTKGLVGGVLLGPKNLEEPVERQVDRGPPTP